MERTLLKPIYFYVKKNVKYKRHRGKKKGREEERESDQEKEYFLSFL